MIFLKRNLQDWLKEEENTNGLQLRIKENFSVASIIKPNQPWWKLKHMERVNIENQNWQRTSLEKQRAAGMGTILLLREGGSGKLESAHDTLQNLASPPFSSVSPFLKLNVIYLSLQMKLSSILKKSN